MEQELERMVVRLMGDGTSYSDALAKAITETQDAAAKMEAAMNEAAAARRAHEEGAAMGRAVTQSVMNATERYGQEVAKLDELLKAGHISQETYNRALERASLILPQLSNAFDKVSPSTNLATAAANRHAESLRQAEGLYQSTRTETERYGEKVSNLNRLLRDGYISQETFNRAMAQTQSQIKATSFSMKEMGESISSVGLTFTATGALIAGATGLWGRQALESAGKFEQTTVAFSVMLGSAAETKKTMDDLTEFAAKTPYEMPEIEQAARGLIQFGERGDQLMNTLKILGNAAAGTSTDFGMVAMIFNQIRGVGKLLTQDFRQLSTRGILSLQDLADYYKVPTAAAQEMLSEGKITFEDVRKIFQGLSEEGGRFANMTEKQSQTYKGLWSTLKDDIGIIMRQIGDEIMPIAKEIVNGLLKFTGWIRGLPPEVKRAVAVLGGLVFVMGTLVTSIGGFLMMGGKILSTFAQFATVIGQLAGPATTVAGAMGSMSGAAASTVGPVTALATSLGSIAATVGVVALAAAAIAAIGYAIYYAAFDVGTFNEEMERSKKLNEELLKQDQARREEGRTTFRKMSEKDPTEKIAKKKAGGDLLKKEEQELAAYEKRLKSLQKTADELQPTWKSLWMSTVTGQWTVAAEEASQMNARLEQQKKFVNELRKEVEGMTIETSQWNAEATEGAQKYLESLRERIDADGQGAVAAKIRALEEKKADQSVIRELKAANAMIEANDKLKARDDKAQKYIDSLNDEAKSLQKLTDAQIRAEFASQRLSAQKIKEMEIAQNANRMSKWDADIKKQSEALDEEARSIGKTKEQLALLNLEQQMNKQLALATTDAERQKIQADMEGLKAKQEKINLAREEQKLADEAKQLNEKHMSSEEKLAKTYTKLAQMQDKGLISQKVFDAEMKKATEEFNKLEDKDVKLTMHFGGNNAVKKGSDEYYKMLNDVVSFNAKTAQKLENENKIGEALAGAKKDRAAKQSVAKAAEDKKKAEETKKVEAEKLAVADVAAKDLRQKSIKDVSGLSEEDMDLPTAVYNPEGYVSPASAPDDPFGMQQTYAGDESKAGRPGPFTYGSFDPVAAADTYNKNMAPQIVNGMPVPAEQAGRMLKMGEMRQMFAEGSLSSEDLGKKYGVSGSAAVEMVREGKVPYAEAMGIAQEKRGEVTPDVSYQQQMVETLDRIAVVLESEASKPKSEVKLTPIGVS